MKNVAAFSLILATGLDYNDSADTRSVLESPLIVERPDFNSRQPVIVAPVSPSETGHSYIGDDAIHTPKMDCIRSVATGALVCNAR
jgi:hypothetical protein